MRMGSGCRWLEEVVAVDVIENYRAGYLSSRLRCEVHGLSSSQRDQNPDLELPSATYTR